MSSAQEPADDQPDLPDGSLTRRRFMRLSAAGAGAVGAGGVASRAGYEPVGRSEAVGPAAVFLGLAAASAVSFLIGAGSGYVASELTSDEFDGLTPYEKHLAIYTDLREMSRVDLGLNQPETDGLLQAVRNEAANLENAAYNEISGAIMAAANNERGVESAKQEAKEAVEELYAVPEQNLVNHWAKHYETASTCQKRAEDLAANSDAVTSAEDITEIWDRVNQTYVSTGSYYGTHADLRDILWTLVDGSTDTVTGFNEHRDYVNGRLSPIPPDYSQDRVKDAYDCYNEDLSGGGTLRNGETLNEMRDLLRVHEPDPADYDSDADDPDLDGTIDAMDPEPFVRIHKIILDGVEKMKTEAEKMADDWYEDAEAGEFNFNQMTTPVAMWQTVQDASTAREAALAFTSMGLQRAHSGVRIDLDPFDETEEEQVYDGILGASTEVEPLPVGQAIDPNNYHGIHFEFAYEYEDEETGEMQADIEELIKPFEIVQTEDGSSELAFEEEQVARAGLTAEEIEEILEEHYQTQQDAQDQTIEFDLGVGLPSIGGYDPMEYGPVAAIVGGLLLLLRGAGDDN